MQSSVAVLLALVGAACAFDLAYVFPNDYETVLSAPLRTTFSCAGRSYGYYADQDNDCKVFHVCLPLTDELGEPTGTGHFSFICGNATRFDQTSLTCAHEDEAFPCSEASQLFDLSNRDFGRVDVEFNVRGNL